MLESRNDKRLCDDDVPVMLVILCGSELQIFVAALSLLEEYKKRDSSIDLLLVQTPPQNLNSKWCVCSVFGIKHNTILEVSALNQSTSSIMFIEHIRRFMVSVHPTGENDALTIRPCPNYSDTLLYNPVLYSEYLRQYLHTRPNVVFANQRRDASWSILVPALLKEYRHRDCIIFNFVSDVNYANHKRSRVHWEGVRNSRLPGHIRLMGSKITMPPSIKECPGKVFQIKSNSAHDDLRSAFIGAQLVTDTLSVRTSDINFHYPKL